MSARGLKILEQRTLHFLWAWKSYGGHLVYKFHAAYHIAERAVEQGNPREYWCYFDEQMNKVMQAVARSLHPGRQFYVTFLRKVLFQSQAA
eukprot:5529377-Pyramimonas_sp.AAC.1